jgi:nucleotide-binding universal stress UspA family protein
MEPFSTIVAAVDFSETSCDVVRAALELARDGDAHIRLVHAVPHVIQTPWVVDASGLDVDDLQRQWVAEAEAQIAELAAGLRLDPRRVSTDILVGPAATAIVGYARAHAADTIVVGSHGRGVIRRLLLGSVAECVLREASCPVLVVPDRALRSSVAEVRSMRAASRSGHAA